MERCSVYVCIVNVHVLYSVMHVPIVYVHYTVNSVM